MRYTVLEDQLFALIESLSSEPDILIRLKTVRRMKEQTIALLRKAEREAAYKARMKYTIADVADAVGIGTKELDYLVRVYLVNNPEQPSPVRRERVDISGYMDLSRE